MTSRVVRTLPDFFARLDDQLSDQSGPNDEPSTADFLAYEMIAIGEKFAND